MSEIFLDRNTELDTIEVTTKNKFRWSWLWEKDSNGDFLSHYVRKIPESGVAYCLFCKHRLLYGSRGKSFILRHAMSKHHICRRYEFRTSSLNNHSLTATSQATQSLEQGQESSNLCASSTTSFSYHSLAPSLSDKGQGVSKKQKSSATRSAEVKPRPRTNEETPQSGDQQDIVNDQLDFLNRNGLLEPKIEMSDDPSEHSVSVSHEEEEEEEEESLHPTAILPNVTHEEMFSQERSPTNGTPSCKKRKVAKEPKANLDSQPTSSTTNDERHMLFLRSLLPSLRQLDEEQTLEFHMGVLKLLQDIRKQKSAPSADNSPAGHPYFRNSHPLVSVKHFTAATKGNAQNNQN